MQIGMIGLGRMGANMVQAADCARARVRGVRHQRRRRARQRGRGRARRASIGEFVEQLAAPRAVWLMVPAGVVDRQIDELVAAARRRATSSSTAATPAITTTSPGRDAPAARQLHYLDVGTSGGVWGLERGYCLMIGGEADVVAAPRSGVPRARAGRRRPGAGRRRAARPGTAEPGLPALRPVRRRALREDGPQRDRVRPHGGLRRGLECPAPRQRRRAHRGATTPRPRRCETRALPVRPRSGARSPRCGGAAA